MDSSDLAYEDRDHGHGHRKHRRHHREERHRKGNDDLDHGRDSGSRRSKDEKHRDGERQRYSSRDSPDDVEHRRGRSKSYDRRDMDSAERDRDERHRDRDGHHRSARDSSRDIESHRERSKSHDRGDVDSAEQDKDERHRERERHHRSARDSPRDIEPNRERSRSCERGVRDSVECDHMSREESVERRSSKKRKGHVGGNEDTPEKRSRLLDGTREVKKETKRERRHFEDRISEDAKYLNGNHEERRRDERRSKDKLEEVGDVGERRRECKFTDRVKEEQLSYGEDRREERRLSDVVKEEKMSDGEEARVVSKEERRGERRLKNSENMDKLVEKRSKDRMREEFGYQEDMKPQVSATTIEKKAVAGKVDGKQKALEKEAYQTMGEVEQQIVAVADVSNATMASSHPQLPKVSMISTINQNEEVSIIRSDEVTGKFSADGAGISVAGKSSSLSLDALAKAKKALQMQKELSEKLKKIPLLNKIPSSSTGSGGTAGSKGGAEAPSSVDGQGSSSTSMFIASQPTLDAASLKPPSSSATAITGLTAMPNYEAVKRAQELAARMGFRHDPQFAPLINMFPGTMADVVSVPQKPSKAPVLRLDAQGREIDEHGNVINMPKPTSLSTLKVNINKQKKEAFQILKPELDVDVESNPHFDERMGINKTKLLRPKRMAFQFVEEGKWARQAEIIKFKSQFGEAQAKELKLKQAQLAKAKAEPDINPNLIEVSVRSVKEKQKDPIPEIEWWDQPILISGKYSESIDEKLNMEKINIYIEHPLPIEPPAEPAPPPPQPLKLTKKEQKKLRTQRRLAKERDRQEMIRQGLIEPPKPKVKMSNLMKVLGSEATQDPTRLEMEIRSAAAEREQAHVDRNIARKLTPAERREKKERKLFEDPHTLETIVSVYKINSLAHPKNRFRVDVNAQENRLTGCAVVSEGVCVVVVEGCKKSNKRYKKLMLKRIDWAADVGDENEGSETLDTPVNKCVLVWEGSVAKPSFNRFLIHQCNTEAAARKVFADAGVEHYWDLAANFSDEVI